MENKMNDFIKITEGEKVALIDPIGKVCLGVSKRFADNLDKPEFQEKLYPVWKQQTEFIKEIENNHEKINTVYLMVTRKCNMNCDFCAISANDKLRPEKEFKLEDIQNKVIPFFQENKPHKMIITGGEPLIKVQIVEIAKALRNGLSCPITLQSNGLALTDTVFISEVRFCIDSIFFFHDLIQSCISHHNGIQNRIFVVFEMILLQERKTFTRCDDDLSVRRLKLSGQNLKKCRFTRTVCSDQTVAVSFCKFNINIFEQGFFTNP